MLEQSEIDNEELIKSESPRSRAEWRELVNACESRGDSWRDFCAERGLRYKRFRYWVGVFEREARVGDFQEVEFGADILSTKESYEVELSNSLLVRVPGNFRENVLIRLVSTLRDL